MTEGFEIIDISDEELILINKQLEERDKELKKLAEEASLLNELFEHLTDLIMEQTPMISSIEENINSSSYRVEKAENELIKADEYQRSYTRKLVWVITAVVGIIILKKV